MRNLSRLLAFSLTMVLLTTGSVTAQPIDGTIQFFGIFETDSPGDLNSATEIYFGNTATMIGDPGTALVIGGTDDLNSEANAIFYSFKFEPFITSVIPLWETDNFVFDLHAIAYVGKSPTTLPLREQVN